MILPASYNMVTSLSTEWKESVKSLTVVFPGEWAGRSDGMGEAWRRYSLVFGKGVENMGLGKLSNRGVGVTSGTGEEVKTGTAVGILTGTGVDKITGFFHHHENQLKLFSDKAA